MAALKELLNPTTVRKISENLERIWPDFDSKSFQKLILKDLKKNELKDRVRLIAHALQKQVPLNEKAVLQLRNTLFHEKSNPNGLQGFEVWPLTEYVSIYGLEEFDQSMRFLEEATKVFTAEFAVRPFFKKNPEKMLEHFLKWSKHPNEHLRRLASEGSRPLLPWGEKLEAVIKDPELTFPILKNLENDVSAYVQKSVANHWNDHSKNHPDWTTQNLKNHPNQWIQKHALRTLLKNGHPQALALLGFSKTTRIELKKFSISPKKITWNQKLKVTGLIQNLSQKSQQVMVDLVLRLPAANKKKIREKVFKGTFFTLEEQKELQFFLPFRKISTRQYYPGKYSVHFRINGMDFPTQSFRFYDKM